MKKNALSLVELLIAMSLIAAISVLMIKNFDIFMKTDTDLLKYKPVLASISEAVYQMVNDADMYPTKKGFADTSEGSYPGDSKSYKGKSKFWRLFKSKFNVLEGTVSLKDNEDNEDNTKDIPAYKTVSINSNGETEYIIHSTSLSKLHCFVENRGVMYCLPDTSVNGDLASIYIRTYFNTVNPQKISDYSNKKAIYFEVSKDGKVSLPPTVKTDKNVVVDCFAVVYNDKKDPEKEKVYPYNDYNQCLVRASVAAVDIYTSKKEY